MSEHGLINDCLNELTKMEQLIQANPLGQFDSEGLLVCMQTMDKIKQVATTLASAELIHITESVRAVLMEMTDTDYVKHDVAPALLTALDAMKVTLLSSQTTSSPRQHDNNLPSDKASEVSGLSVWQIDLVPKKTLFQQQIDIIVLFQQLALLGELNITTDITQLPPFFDYDPESCYVSWHATLTGDMTRVDIADILRSLTTAVDYQLTLQAPPHPTMSESDLSSPIEQQEDITSLQHILSRLTAIRHQLQAIDLHQADLTQIALSDATERLITLTQDMQSKVVNMNMVSSDIMFQNVINEGNVEGVEKQIDMRIEGKSIALAHNQQRQLQTVISTLMHYLIQYHIDVENRRELGKPSRATITFDARLDRQRIQLVMTDDGCGQSSTQITAQKTMTALESTINALGGTIMISHQFGEGSQHRMTFPMQQTLITGQIITVANHHYIVPLSTIMATHTYNNREIDTVIGQGDVYLFEDDYLPVIRLQEVLGLDDDGLSDVVMVVEIEGIRAAFLIADVLSQQTVMMTNLETHYQSVFGIAGAATIEDGHSMLVLDLLAFMTPDASVPDNKRLA